MLNSTQTITGECDKCGKLMCDGSLTQTGIWSIETSHQHLENDTAQQVVEKRVVAAYCDDCSPLMRLLLSEVFSPWVATECCSEEVHVILEDIGGQKINVIKAVRAATSLGLKEAKDLVESNFSEVARFVKKEAAWIMKEEIESVGGSVSLFCSKCDHEIS
tara:strand:+ start:323 stop:805 length:483 start_codon:yes stop_codon:yes gene_type:complete